MLNRLPCGSVFRRSPPRAAAGPKKTRPGRRARLILRFLTLIALPGAVQASPAHAPDASGSATSGNSAVELFGSVSVPFGPIGSSQWDRHATPQAPSWATNCGSEDGLCATPLGRDMSARRSQRLRTSTRDMIADVNMAVNRIIAYRSDRDAHGLIDHWASFEETARAGTGDCEDFAIAKMRILQDLGMPPSAMRLVVLLDSRRGRFHAVLAVRTGQEWLVLDNAADAVRTDADIGHYLPVYSLSSQKSWIHGFRSSRQVAFGSLDSVYPGEPPLF
ncbi:MAG TPA: transglutaminase-like cysteine peptidase [Afifellaceae bacterium]|nr:transglutaminase-like cysteine peptidase [Afifellaceae bacterium]